MNKYTLYFGECGEYVRSFLAPNLQEAMAQCYKCMVNIKIDGDIVDGEETDHKSILYQDTENGNILTEDELYAEYAESYPTREITFSGFLRNCINKNGFLEVAK